MLRFLLLSGVFVDRLGVGDGVGNIKKHRRLIIRSAVKAPRSESGALSIGCPFSSPLSFKSLAQIIINYFCVRNIHLDSLFHRTIIA